jgi:uncharacterized iron-regulated membrane protein
MLQRLQWLNSRMRKTLFQLHLLGAAVGGLFIVILGLTGSIMAFEEELDHLTHPRLFRVSPQGAPLPLATLAARAIAASPGKPVVTYGLGVSPDLPWSVNVGGTIVFVNEYTGEILGTRSGPTWLGQIHQLHLRLLAGDTGKTIVSWADVVMLLLSLSGIYLWWPIKRITINAAARGRRFWFDVHNAVGVCAFLLVFLLAVTGAVIAFDAWTTPLLYRVTGSHPAQGGLAVTPMAAQVLTPDQALALARNELPGAVPVSINVPGAKTPYRIALRYPEDRTPGGRSRVFIDQYRGTVLQVESSRTTAAGTRMVILNRAIHTGDVLGMPTKVLMSLASLAAVAQAISGLMMWWKRRQSRSAR